MIAFYLASSSWVVRFAVDEFDTMFLCLGFEELGYELFAVVQIDAFRDSASVQSPPQRVDCLPLPLVQIRFGDYPVP